MILLLYLNKVFILFIYLNERVLQIWPNIFLFKVLTVNTTFGRSVHIKKCKDKMHDFFFHITA